MIDDYEQRDKAMNNVKDILIAVLVITLLLCAGFDW